MAEKRDRGAVSSAGPGSVGATVSATDAKNAFGRILEEAMRGKPVVITKHDDPKAVLMSFEDFRRMTNSGERVLDTLSEEFDELLSRMQTQEVRAGVEAALGASPKDLGKAAVRAAKPARTARRKRR